jgi:mono/diheme cytochrome c family protein
MLPSHRHVACVALAACAGLQASIADAAEMPDLERGRALYENHCIACHGRSVHARPGRPAPTHLELQQIVERWQAAERLRWSAQDIADVAAFLERFVYRERDSGG